MSSIGALQPRSRSAYSTFAAVVILVPLACIFLPNVVSNPKWLLAICVLICAPFFFLKTQWSAFAVISILNLHFYALGAHTVVYAALLLFISGFISKRNGAAFFKSNPIRKYFILYLLSILPSFSNTSDLAQSLFYSFNLISVFLLFETLGGIIESRNQIISMAKAFLFWTVLNSFVVFWLARFSHDRIFGFTGVVFVDFACVAILILLSRFLFSIRKYSHIILFLISVVLSALFLTQTRNTLISLFLTLAVIFAYSCIFPETLPFPRMVLIRRFLTISAVFVGVVGALFIVKPDSFKRHRELVSTEKVQHSKPSMGAITNNTIGSRLLIWITALNGFIKHPIIGIGAYSFGFDSNRYNFLPKFLFKTFVEGLSPHITYLAVLTETGIIGMVGFMILIFFSLRLSFASVGISRTPEQKNISAGILLAHIYITFSMAFSDAWLWHQCAILWGFVLGISIANHNLLKTESESFGS